MKHPPRLPKGRIRIGRGLLRGRTLEFRQEPDLRPTLARVREAVFSMIADKSGSFGFMDLCAGSGIMAFEAFSMGFEPVLMFEPHGPTRDILAENTFRLGASIGCFNRAAETLENLSIVEKAWVIYADPPYRSKNFHVDLLHLLAGFSPVKSGSLYLAEHEKDHLNLPVQGWQTLKQKRYGRTHISLLEKN